MKIYEKIVTDAMTDGELSENYYDRDSTKISLISISLFPCTINETEKYLSDKEMDHICEKCRLDCTKCLDEYLDQELQEVNKEVTT